MKILLRLICIFFLTFFSIGINSGHAEFDVSLANRDVYSVVGENIYFNLQKNADSKIVSTINSNEYEIRNSRSGNGGGNFSPENAISNNNFYAQQYKIYSNKLINSKSHNISSYLKNEICVRAP